MRRLVLSLALLCCFAIPSRGAQGVNLRWDSCLGDGGVRNRTFACDTNVGSEQLFASFQLDSALASVTGMEFALQISTPAGLPDSWWQFKNAGSCRQTALSASSVPLVPSESCVDFWQGMASGGVTAYIANLFPPARLQGVFALPPVGPASLEPATEYFAVRLAITHAKTTGPGYCPGCLDPVCIGLESIKLTRPAGVNNLVLSTETAPGSSTVNWQGSASGSTQVVDIRYFQGGFIIDNSHRNLTCAAATPARNGTWGSIKSLYR